MSDKRRIVKKLICQYPVVKGADIKCAEVATKYDRWGFAYCNKHAPENCSNLRYVDE
jgi:hypothetical protein